MQGMMLYVLYIQYIHLNIIEDLEVNAFIVPNLQAEGKPQKFNCEPLEASRTRQPAAWPLGRQASGSIFLLAEYRHKGAVRVDQARGWLWKGQVNLRHLPGIVAGLKEVAVLRSLELPLRFSVCVTKSGDARNGNRQVKKRSRIGGKDKEWG